MVEFNTKEYWEKRLKQNVGLQGVGCLGYGKYYNMWLYKVRAKIFNDSIRVLNLNFQELKVLDIGSGTGFYLNLWKSLGVKSITGTDIAEISVEHLKESMSGPNISIVQLDIGCSLRAQGFFKNNFDIITAFDVLFHIVDDNAYRKAIFNIAFLLKSGGYFIFTDNFPHGKTIRTTHQVSRSIEEISRILKEAGFCILKRMPVFFLMNSPVDTRGYWPLLLWRLLMSPVRMIDSLGFLYGAILFPIEVFFAKVLKEGPSTEMMICQKCSSL